MDMKHDRSRHFIRGCVHCIVEIQKLFTARTVHWCTLACIIFIVLALYQLFYWVGGGCQHTSTLAVLGKVNITLAKTDQTEIKQKY